MTLSERLSDGLTPEPNTGCRLWTGYVVSGGYGQFKAGGTKHSVHRLAWELAHGPIPKGMFVCHKCDQPGCAELSHLFLGTPTDNVRDMMRKGRDRNPSSIKTHCKRGHPLEGENLIRWGRDRKWRACRICQREHSRRYEERRRAA